MPGGEWDSLGTATLPQVIMGGLVLLSLKQCRSKTDSKTSPVSYRAPRDERNVWNWVGKAEKTETVVAQTLVSALERLEAGD